MQPFRFFSPVVSLSFFSVCLLAIASAGAVAEEVDELFDLSLKDLLHMEVTSAARREQTLLSAPAAIYVISRQQLERKGITSVPEALRGVPGIQVAALDGNKWIVSSRGFSGRYANKLLVQIDGRSVYTPSYSGVYWDMQDLMIENIDRIEVIRGPGATLWGANAVNGIINIITKNAADTQGWLIKAGAGNQTEGLLGARYGAQLSENRYSRVYLKGQASDSNKRLASGESANDSWSSLSTGFRIDSTRGTENNWTLQGDLYRSDLNQTLNTVWLPMPATVATDVEDKADIQGANLLGRWVNHADGNTISTLQAYWDYAKRDELYIEQQHNTFDLDFQQQLNLNEKHQLVWGLGYRHLESDYTNSFAVRVDDQSRDLFSGFIQDEIAISPDELTLTLGSKLEHNDFTGWEVQPSARIMWFAQPGHTLWGSISRAVRTPSAIEDSGQVVSGLIAPPPLFTPTFLYLQGSSSLKSESLIAYELGYRFHGSNYFSLDSTLFYNDYDDVVSYETSVPDINVDNKLDGYTYGLELSASWQVNSNWNLSSNYSYLRSNFKAASDSTDITSAAIIENASPEHMFSVHSSLDVSEDIAWDLWLNYTDSIQPSATFSEQVIDDYLSLNTRFGWQVNPHLNFSVTANNILDSRHSEYVGEFFSVPTELERSVIATLKWTY